MADLQQWMIFWAGVKAEGSAEDRYKVLKKLYSSEHRDYHDFSHVSHMLDEFDAARHLSKDPYAIEMAIWYHDSIYDTEKTDNEAKSAEFAYDTAIEIGLSEEFAKKTHDLILATTHADHLTDIDEQLLVDIDLTPLGSSNQQFTHNTMRIRKEYRWLDDAAFSTGRTAMFRRFLERPSIYFTDFFKDKYEEQARKNLRNALHKSSSKNA